MKKYKVILHEDAKTDISSAFEWGRRAWGEENLAPATLSQLARAPHLNTAPMSCGAGK